MLRVSVAVLVGDAFYLLYESLGKRPKDLAVITFSRRVKSYGGGRLDVVFRFGVTCFARCAECPRLFLFCFCTCLLCCVRYSDSWLFSLSLSRSPTPFRSVCPLAQVHPRGYAPPKIRGRGGIDNKTS